MILAIDVGNSAVDIGLWDGEKWLGHWEVPTSGMGQFATAGSPIHELLVEAKVKLADSVIISSVVPKVNDLLIEFFRPLQLTPVFVSASTGLGLTIHYDPPDSLGADRIANALGALAHHQPPILVIDIGTATTFDAIDKHGAFIGGAIMPGPQTSSRALTTATAQLPDVELKIPISPIGQTTEAALQSGLVLGYAAAVQGLATKIVAELGVDTTVIATGGFGELFQPLCPIIKAFSPTLTLDGLIIAASRLRD